MTEESKANLATDILDQIRSLIGCSLVSGVEYPMIDKVSYEKFGEFLTSQKVTLRFSKDITVSLDITQAVKS